MINPNSPNDVFENEFYKFKKKVTKNKPVPENYSYPRHSSHRNFPRRGFKVVG